MVPRVGLVVPLAVQPSRVYLSLHSNVDHPKRCVQGGPVKGDPISGAGWTPLKVSPELNFTGDTPTSYQFGHSSTRDATNSNLVVSEYRWPDYERRLLVRYEL